MGSRKLILYSCFLPSVLTNLAAIVQGNSLGANAKILILLLNYQSNQSDGPSISFEGVDIAPELPIKSIRLPFHFF